MAVAPSFSETNLLVIVIIALGIIFAGEITGYSLLDALKKNPVSKSPSGIERIGVKPERAMIIDTGDGLNASVEYGDIKDSTANWIVDFHAIMLQSHNVWDKQIKRGELVLNDNAPRELIGSSAVFLKYVPGGGDSLTQQKLKAYENLFAYQEGAIADLQALIQTVSMSKEAQSKIDEGLEAIKNRQRYRKNGLEGLGFGNNTTAMLGSGTIGGT